MTFLWLLAGLRTPFLDKLMQLITYFGQEIIIIAVICALYWCVDKRFAYLLGFIYFTAGLCVQALKITFRIPRPWVLDPKFQAVESAIPAATGYSFPSGHTQGATCLFFPLSLKLKNIWLRILCILAFLLVGFSRMYLGCHTPKDVLVSMGISLICSCIIWHFQSFLLDDTSHIGLTSCILGIFSLAVAVYALTLHESGTIDTKYAADCCKAAGAGLGYAVGWYLERRYLNFDVRAGSIGIQALKLFIGLAAALLIKECITLLIGSSIMAKSIEYFILVLWILVIYPALFGRLLNSKSSS